MSDITILTVPVFSALANLAFNLRREVFVIEQKVPPEEELDSEDLTAIHMVAIVDGEVCGTLRILRRPEHYKIGRVAVSQPYRGMGIARALMVKAMEERREECGDRFYLTSQSDKVGFYEKLGFTAFGEEFMDAGIPHLAMKNY
ncbi:GNAT family N-acetyltransferase [Rhizobium sp. KVB221]|uniref:GNAT family N-acetyltransferase n=1 Tax=Rhizobium setariae TaxID=2801340 RepID=A0A936YUF9_9HYPH|nr:GNAT family N-acetyltransferase [Rhizobium setariae]MBL0375257.1 GNAT family N-acetyltransferase [Rhizobium setariae]